MKTHPTLGDLLVPHGSVTKERFKVVAFQQPRNKDGSGDDYQWDEDGDPIIELLLERPDGTRFYERERIVMSNYRKVRA